MAATRGPGGRIYAIGGVADDYLHTVEAYDPLSDQWSTMAPLLFARRCPGVALGADGRIYAIGGFGGLHKGVTTVEAYDSVADQWEPVSPMKGRAMNDMAATAGVGGRIYAMAPSAGEGPHIFETYDPNEDLWTPLAPPNASYDAGLPVALVATRNGLIFAFGRRATEHAVEAYDPQQDAWEFTSALQHHRWGFGTGLGGDGKVYVIGGEDGRTMRTVAVVEAYEDRRWIDAEPMSIPRGSFGCATGADGSIYAIGGYRRDERVDELVEAIDVFVPQRDLGRADQREG